MKPNSCKYKEIHSGYAGAVHQCKECGNIKVEIGNMMALISRDSFHLILEDFVARKQFYIDNGNYPAPDDKINICLNQCNLFLCLSTEEFEDVIDLFQVSNHMLKAQDILDLQL